MRLSEIRRIDNVGKDDATPKSWEDSIGNAKPTGKTIGGYEIYIDGGGIIPIWLLIKDPNDEGFLGRLELDRFHGMFQTTVDFAPELQGKKLAVPLYVYAIKELGYTLVSDFEQSPGGEYIWKQLAERPDVNVYIYNHSDKTFHGEYDPRDSGSVYGVEKWRANKGLLVATTDTITSVDESLKESVDIPEPDDDFFKRNRFKRTEYGGMKLVYGYAYDLFQIYAYSAYDQAMGAVMFRYDSDCDCYQADDVFVETRFRRQGVASAMYDFAKTKLDAPIKPSTAQTDKGAAFWGKKEVWEAATPDDIFYMISDIHTGHNDIETDEEFQQWVGSFDKYELKDIPLSKLKVSQSNINADKAKSYIKQKNAPPIVVDGTNYWIIDGHHRVAAALARGDKTIKGYVGLNELNENFADGKKKGKSRPGRVKRAGASCQGSVSHLRSMAKKYGGERGRMYHWCANMKGGKKKKK